MAAACCPMWWVSAPQQPAPGDTTTSTPHPRQQADRGLVDLGRQHLLRAAGQQCHAGAPFALRAMDLRLPPSCRAAAPCQAPAQASRATVGQIGQSQGAVAPTAAPARAPSSAARNSAGRGSTVPSMARKRTLVPRPAIGLLDIAARVIDQVHVVHAGRTGGHAGEAGQAAIDVAHHLLGGRTARLQHVLDQVDAAARTVEFVAEQQEGRTGRGAHAAMHAGAQHLIGRAVSGSRNCSAVKLVCIAQCLGGGIRAKQKQRQPQPEQREQEEDQARTGIFPMNTVTNISATAPIIRPKRRFSDAPLRIDAEILERQA